MGRNRGPGIIATYMVPYGCTMDQHSDVSFIRELLHSGE